MSYRTRLDPPPAHGWVPPPLPPLTDLTQPKAETVSTPATKRRAKAALPPASESTPTPTPTPPRKANLFEPAPVTLFDDESETAPPEPVPPPAVMGKVIVNGRSAQLLAIQHLASGATEYQVVLEETGEIKKFVSPPAHVELRP